LAMLPSGKNRQTFPSRPAREVRLSALSLRLSAQFPLLFRRIPVFFEKFSLAATVRPRRPGSHFIVFAGPLVLLDFGFPAFVFSFANVSAFFGLFRRISVCGVSHLLTVLYLAPSYGTLIATCFLAGQDRLVPTGTAVGQHAASKSDLLKFWLTRSRAAVSFRTVNWNLDLLLSNALLSGCAAAGF